MRTAVYTHPDGLKHDTGPGHPERPARLQTILDLLDSSFPALPVHEAPYAGYADLKRAHTERYIDALEAIMPDEGYAYADGDTVLCPGTWNAALSAAGAVCRAVDDIAAKKIERAFCAVRPPGHHAEPDRAMGFCLFNNIFIGARRAQDLHGFTKVAIVDFDVHHGNGTDAMTRRAENIFYASTHQWPLFPMTGRAEDDIPGTVMNVPLAAGDGSVPFRAAYEEFIIPALHKFGPDLLMISAGFDAHKNDPLAALHLTEDDFTWVTQKLTGVADKFCNGAIVSVLEGGYDLNALEISVAAHLRALSGSGI